LKIIPDEGLDEERVLAVIVMVRCWFGWEREIVFEERVIDIAVVLVFVAFVLL